VVSEKTEQDQSEQRRSERSGGIRAFFEFGPNWIIALTGLAAALGGGAAIGHFVVPPASNGTPGPRPTVTVTVPASPSPSAIPSGSATPSPESTDPGSTGPAAGTVLGSYHANLATNYGMPVADKAPTQDQFVFGGGPSTDLYNTAEGSFSAQNPDQIFALSNGVAPSYSRCINDTKIAQQASSSRGTTFCLKEAARMVGVTVGLTSPSGRYTVVHVTLWSLAS
jgi:hypothetical protein